MACPSGYEFCGPGSMKVKSSLHYSEFFFFVGIGRVFLFSLNEKFVLFLAIYPFYNSYSRKNRKPWRKWWFWDHYCVLFASDLTGSPELDTGICCKVTTRLLEVSSICRLIVLLFQIFRREFPPVLLLLLISYIYTLFCTLIQISPFNLVIKWSNLFYSVLFY